MMKVTDCIAQAAARMGQKNSDKSIFEVMVTDLVEFLTRPSCSLTLQEVDLALRLGSQGKLTTTYRHVHSAAIFQWLKEYETSLRGPAAYAVHEAAKKRNSAMPELSKDSRTLLDTAIERVKEGRHFYASHVLYTELVEQGKINLTTEDKWRLIDRAIEIEVKDCQDEMLNPKSFIRQTAKNKLNLLRAYDPVNRTNKPDWIDATARFLAVRDYIQTIL
jgi:hypothetical protein